MCGNQNRERVQKKLVVKKGLSLTFVVLHLGFHCNMIWVLLNLIDRNFGTIGQ